MSALPKTGTKCIPAAPAARCQSCDRWATRRPRDPNHGYEHLVIDASAILSAERCPFYVGGPKRPDSMFFPNPQPRVQFDATQIGGAA